MLTIKDSRMQYPPGTILNTETGQPVSFEALIEDLSSVAVVYVGEQHNDPEHHRIQRQIIEALYRKNNALKVGMEMFDRTYDPVLARWSSGAMEEAVFLRQTHWYANWRYDFSLYREILETVRDLRLPLYGLNLPFHIPPKIATGGIDSLLECDRSYLPQEVDLTVAPHRDYVKGVFEGHRIRGREDFELFYGAQCVWEDAMAESIARDLGQGPMVVLAGNGHIIEKFGIPQRAFRRTRAPFKTVYLAAAGQEAQLVYGDYLWVTPASRGRGGP